MSAVWTPFGTFDFSNEEPEEVEEVSEADTIFYPTNTAPTQDVEYNPFAEPEELLQYSVGSLQNSTDTLSSSFGDENVLASSFEGLGSSTGYDFDPFALEDRSEVEITSDVVYETSFPPSSSPTSKRNKKHTKHSPRKLECPPEYMRSWGNLPLCGMICPTSFSKKKKSRKRFSTKLSKTTKKKSSRILRRSKSKVKVSDSLIKEVVLLQGHELVSCPENVLYNIFSHLSACDILRMSMVNKFFKQFCSSPYLWKNQYLKKTSASSFVRHYGKHKQFWDEEFSGNMWKHAMVYRLWHNIAMNTWSKVSKNEVFIDVIETLQLKTNPSGITQEYVQGTAFVKCLFPQSVNLVLFCNNAPTPKTPSRRQFIQLDDIVFHSCVVVNDFLQDSRKITFHPILHHQFHLFRYRMLFQASRSPLWMQTRFKLSQDKKSFTFQIAVANRLRVNREFEVVTVKIPVPLDVLRCNSKASAGRTRSKTRCIVWEIPYFRGQKKATIQVTGKTSKSISWDEPPSVIMTSETIRGTVSGFKIHRLATPGLNAAKCDKWIRYSTKVQWVHQIM